MDVARLLPIVVVFLVAGALLFSKQLYAPPQVIVTWETESELDTAGFHLYRSDSEAGPFVRITDQLIPASPDPNTGGSYSFPDQNVASGHTYYYQLEDIENSGAATRHGPIIVEARGGWNPYGIGSLLLLILVALWSLRRSPVASAEALIGQ